MCIGLGAWQLWAHLVANLLGLVVFVSVLAATFAFADLGLDRNVYHAFIFPRQWLVHFTAAFSILAIFCFLFNVVNAAFLLVKSDGCCCSSLKALVVAEVARLFLSRVPERPRVKSEHFTYVEGENEGESFVYTEGGPKTDTFFFVEGDLPVETVEYEEGEAPGETLAYAENSRRAKENFFTFFEGIEDDEEIESAPITFEEGEEEATASPADQSPLL